MSFLNNFAFEAGVVARSVGDYLRGGALRLGVTGLSRAGKTVFVDVTADWCLTCKANKTLVLEQPPVSTALGGAGAA